ncbi:diguanylate cyclase (GGDEF)-like protein [Saccharothrix tamanrassetensis]|uniref:Diguanylate cyclase (GGDEF)-like protein n=1 Tax=Saccharothrix tamanrassetensis TaxID=1051531 RepID=A0A841CMZ2_9PSEU|nr:GGDEF domain-containing protein [Saccharothrix tamanrassetensis]MBB5956916.1 diguanylate cyclase (GGDEF)-like protein [Saccharothrix tamanrassetensis]
MLGTRRFGITAALALAIATAASVAAGFDLVTGAAAVALDDLAQLATGLFATGSCWWTARRRQGPDRVWRIVMGLGMFGWSVGQSLWTWYQLVEQRAVPSPSPADAGYLSIVPFAFVALLVIGSHRRSDTPDALLDRRSRSARLVLLLDGLIVVGSLFLLTWTTSLGSLVQAGNPSTAAFLVAIAYPLTDLVLLVIVVVLGADRKVVLRPQLRLLGLGLVGLAASDSAFAYLVSVQAPEVPPLANAGFVIGPVLIALAALVPSTPHTAGARAARSRQWAYLLMPYVPLLVSTVLVLRRTAIGDLAPLDAVEIGCGFTVFVAVILRQLATIVDNAKLAAMLRESEHWLVHQAQHDALTGLANRALFERRLDEAMASHHGGRPFGLLFVDLDDFKAVNDVSGHAHGDAVLERVARRLRECVRDTDVVARLGGDEFGVLVEGVDEPEKVAFRILDSLGEEISASVGVVVCADPDPEETAQSVLRRADKAMYQAKRGGGRGLVIHP